MRNRMERNVKRIAAGLLAGALVLTGICFGPTNHPKAYASEVAGASENAVHTEQLEIGKYIQGTERIAPKPEAAGYEGWVFAGWYTDPGCSQETALTKETAETAALAGGTKYAKFVPAELLSVKCQTLADTEEGSRNSQLRLVSTVDNLQYSKVGFEILMEGKQPINYSTDKVYKKITVTDTSASNVVFDYAPKDFHAMAEWFTTVTVVNIQNADFAAGILIRPYWETMDGTLVYGVSRYARVEDYYRNIVNVPVRLYSDKEVAAGYLEVGYDNKRFTYLGKEEGYDVGTVFEEMEAADVVVEGKGKIRCVGNVKDIAKDAKADGLYVNLRFARIGNGTDTAEEIRFEVLNEDFCDNLERKTDVYVPDGVYRQMPGKK